MLPSPATLLEVICASINTLFAVGIGFIAFSLEWSADTYPTADSHPWYHLSNNSWIAVYIVLLFCSISSLFIVRRSAFVCLCTISVILRSYALIAIIAIHLSNSTVLKIDFFYNDVFHYNCVLEPLVYIFCLFNGVKFTFLADQTQEQDDKQLQSYLDGQKHE